MKTTKNHTTLDLLIAFANQRAGLEYANYGDVKAFRAEQREITKDLHDFRELLSLASRRIENLSQKIEQYLQNSNGRLKLVTLPREVGQPITQALEYCTGQYFPTEFRPACCSVLKSLIWNDYRDEQVNGIAVYKDGNEIRKAIRKQVGRRVARNYFN